MNQTRLMVPAVLMLSLLAGCGYSRQLMPLVNEDDRALQYSGENRVLLDKTAAVMAFEEFAKAIRDDDAEGCVARLGPITLALLSGKAAEAGRTLTSYWRNGDIGMIVLPGTGKPVSMLRNRTTVAEIGRATPSNREVTLLVNVEGAGEARIKALFTDRGWVFEFTDSIETSPR